MRVAFLDDSEQTSPPRAGLGHLLAFAAAIFPQESLAPFAEDLARIVASLGIPPGEELKWNPDRATFLRSAGGPLVKTLRRQILEAAASHHIRTVTVIIDHGAVYRSSTQEEVGKEVLKWLYERVTMHLDDHNDVGIMIADKPGGGAREEKRWLASTLELTNFGTEYIQPGRVVLPVLTADSRHVRHLQLADLIAAATTGAIAGNPAALELGPLLAQLMHRHRLRDVNGAGLLPADKRGRVTAKGGATEWVHWQSGTAHLLPRLCQGRAHGPLFLTGRKAPARTPTLDICPATGRARLSYRRAAELFEAHTRALAHPGITDPAKLQARGGWTLHQLRHAALTHEAEDGTSTPILLAAPATPPSGPWSATPGPASTPSPATSPAATQPPAASTERQGAA
jgi:hypothetical protein